MPPGFIVSHQKVINPVSGLKLDQSSRTYLNQTQNGTYKCRVSRKYEYHSYIGAFAPTPEPIQLPQGNVGHTHGQRRGARDTQKEVHLVAACQQPVITLYAITRADRY